MLHDWRIAPGRQPTAAMRRSSASQTLHSRHSSEALSAHSELDSQAWHEVSAAVCNGASALVFTPNILEACCG